MTLDGKFQAYLGTDGLAYWRYRDIEEYIRFVAGQSWPTIPDAVADVLDLFPGVKVEVPATPRKWLLGAVDTIQTASSRGFQLVEHELGIHFGALRVYPVLTEVPGSQSWASHVEDRVLLISLGMYQPAPIYYRDLPKYVNQLKSWAKVLAPLGDKVWLTGRHEPDHLPVINGKQLPSLGTPAEFAKGMTYIAGVMRAEGFKGRLGYNLMGVSYRSGAAASYHFPEAQFCAADGYSGAGGPPFFDVHAAGAKYAVNKNLEYAIWETQCAGTDAENGSWWRAVKDAAVKLDAKQVVVFTNAQWHLGGAAELAAIKEIGA